MFSEKYGYTEPKKELKDSITSELKNRIWNVFYINEIKAGGLSSVRVREAINGEVTIEDKLLDKLGVAIDSSTLKDNSVNRLKNKVMKSSWYEVYDFIELYLSVLDDEVRLKREQQFNCILDEEKSYYRVVRGTVTPITNPAEIEEIQRATNTPLESVNIHISKALVLYARKQTPDYENSIKESISAVEAMCCYITGESGGNATLGRTIKKLNDSDVHIQPALISAFNSLYGYTCDEGGVRHGKMDFSSASAEEAKFMLVICSAFVNYLLEKWNKKPEDNTN